MFEPKIVYARNVNDAFAQGMGLFVSPSVMLEQSRGGDVFSWPGPVITYTANSMERVLFNPLRDANPFFHLFESLWMLAGRNDLAWLSQFNKRMTEYTDDGVTQPAAYGHRWRNHFHYDQLTMVINELKRDHGTRRAVLSMWDPITDYDALLNNGADLPCNTNCFFRIIHGVLYMSIQCRSNDAIWGAHGANAVHFSILMEYIAAKVGVSVGGMTQYSWNYHFYPNNVKFSPQEYINAHDDPYEHRNTCTVSPLFGRRTEPDIVTFDADLKKFMLMAEPNFNGLVPIMEHKFLLHTAKPMLAAWRSFKGKNMPDALNYASQIGAVDWRLACTQWLERRVK